MTRAPLRRRASRCLLLLFVGCGASSPPAAREPAPPAAEATPIEAPGDEALTAARAALADEPLYRVPTGDAPTWGPADAPITIVAFSDFECRYCARAVTILESLRARYGERLRLVFRHFPLPYHRHAKVAHEAAAEARAQGGDEAFWQMHDRLFAVRDLSRDRILSHARAAGLDTQALVAALADGRHRARIEADRELGDRLGVRGTPCFFINGRRLTGAKPPEDFAALIEPMLVEAQARLAAGTPAGALYDAITADGLTELVDTPPPVVRIDPPPVPAHAPRRGAEDPELVVQVFSDFECPYCARMGPMLRRLETDFPEVAIVWRHYPLAQHPTGRLASEAGASIRAQVGNEGFWHFHDALFAAGRLDRGRILEVARSIDGVDAAQVERAMDQRVHVLEIAADMEAGRAAGVRSTPTLLVGGRVVRGAGSYLDLEEVVDAELAGE